MNHCRALCVIGPLASAGWLAAALATRADAQPASTPTAVPCKIAALCDDFESYPVGTEPGGGWTTSVRGGGTVVVDGSKPYSGAKSIHIKVPNARAWGGLSRGKGLLPLAGNNMYGRMMLYQTAAPDGVHWNNISASGDAPGHGRASYLYGGWQTSVRLIHDPGECTANSSMVFPTKRWVCVQWQFDGSAQVGGGTRSEALLWMDGALVPGVSGHFSGGCQHGPQTDWYAPIMTKLDLGWWGFQDNPNPIEVWIDDVAVGEKPINCPSAEAP